MPAIATATVAELVSQMQANLDEINYHLARISDTQAHDDEIERLEFEREKKVELLNQQWEKEAWELDEKKRQAALPATEARRREFEIAVAASTREALEVAAARRREDEEIMARRMEEDEERHAWIQQQEDELRAVVQKEEAEISQLFAEEEEQKKSAALEREDSLFEEYEAQMEKLEDEMEKKTEESQRALADLEQKRQAISAMINEKMRTPRPASFRRGSKRFSSTSASDVAAMLASGKPPLQRQSTLSRVMEAVPREISPRQPAEAHSALLDAICNVEPDEPKEEPKHSPSVTWADQATLPIVRGSHGVMNFLGNSAEMAIVKGRQQSTVSPFTEGNEEPNWFPTPKTIHRGHQYNNTHSPPPNITSHQRKISRTSPFASPRTPHNGLGAATMNTSLNSPQLPHANGLASTMNHGRSPPVASSRPGSTASTPRTPRFTHSRTPSLSSPRTPSSRSGSVVSSPRLANGLGSATMNHGFEKYINRSDTTGTITPKDVIVVGQGEVYDSSHPALAELRWVCEGNVCWQVSQDQLVTVRGSHAMLSLSAESATTKVVRSKLRNFVRNEEIIELPLPKMKGGMANVFWMQDQAELDVVKGSHAMLCFSGNEASTKVVTPNPYWAVDQATLPIIRGSHGTLSFTSTSSSTKFIRPDPYWTLNQATLKTIKGVHGSLAFGEEGARVKIVKENPYWKGNQASLSTIKGQHGMLTFKSGEASVTCVRANPYWALNQSSLSTIRGHHGMLAFTNSDAFLQVVRPDPYWVDQSTLPTIRGHHGTLDFSSSGADVKSVRPDPYWVDQSLLQTLTGQYGKLHFSRNGAITKAITSKIYWEAQLALAINSAARGARAVSRSATRPGLKQRAVTADERYWVDQSTLPIVSGTHGKLSFNDKGASLDVLKENPYWIDQSKVSIVRGSHGKLSFSTRRASVQVMRSNPYWGCDQRDLDEIRGSHAKLAFDDVDASTVVLRADPYWSNDQKGLVDVRGSHGRLSFDSCGTAAMEVVRPNLYWGADQAGLKEVRGINGRLGFGKQRSASLQVVRSDSYWAADQKELSEIRGTHAQLSFGTYHASTTPQRPDPYWSADQKDVGEMRGSHAQLSFGRFDASSKVKRQDPYWSADQKEVGEMRGSHAQLLFGEFDASTKPKRQDPYWSADQKELSEIRGSHAQLSFGTYDASTKPKHPDPYWTSDQHNLPVVWGTHATLAFDEKRSIAEMQIQRPHPYWTADQNYLATIRGSHGTMSFSHSDTASISAVPRPARKANNEYPIAQFSLSQLSPATPTMEHQRQVFTPPQPTYWTQTQNTLASELETGDFYYDSHSDSDCEDYRPSPISPNEPQFEMQTPRQTQSPTKERKSFGPGVIAGLLGIVRENINTPILTNIIGTGSYSSLDNTPIDHQDNDGEGSPRTPIDDNTDSEQEEHPSPPQAARIQEPIIRQSSTSWLDSSQDEDERGEFENRAPLQKVASPLPTQTEFESGFQAPPLVRTVTETWEKRLSGGFNGGRERAGTGSSVGSLNGVPTGRRNRDSFISRTRAMLENVN